MPGLNLAAATGLLVLAGCAAVAGPAARPATGWADPGGWDDPPACVVVLPAAVPPETGLVAVGLEEAVARRLSGRIDLVLGPGRRDALIRRLGLDLGHPVDRRRFAALSGCRHAAATRAWGGRAWAVMWSESRVGLDLAILRLTDGRRLWQARGEGRRGDGGVPLSPLSAAVAAGLAARAALDETAMASALDDALRSALRSLPDFRDPQAFASRNSRVRPLSSRK